MKIESSCLSGVSLKWHQDTPWSFQKNTIVIFWKWTLLAPANSLLASTNSGSKVMKATKAAGMNIIANCEEIAGQTVFHTHVHLVPLQCERWPQDWFYRTRTRLWQTCSSRWNHQNALRSCHEIIQPTPMLQELQPEVIWSQKSLNHHRWSLEYHWPRSSYQGRCRYYPKQPPKSSTSKRTHQEYQEDLTTSLRS